MLKHHNPLVSIKKKPAHSAPKRLQRMSLCKQKYETELIYKSGKEMHIADTQSRVYPKNSVPKVEEQSEFCHQVEDLILTENVLISTDSLIQFCDEDQSLQVLMQVMLKGWPEQRHQVPQQVQAYFINLDELSVQDGLLFKCD